MQTFKRALATASLALAGAFAAVSAAQAAVVVSFDPAYGSAIPNLGFKGTATLDVTQGCYSLGTGFQFIGSSTAPGACNITVLSAAVDFYNTNQGPSSVFFTKTLTGPFGFGGDLGVFGAYFDPTTGELTGIDTADSAVFNVELFDSAVNPVGPNVSFSGSMVLWFESGHYPIGESVTASGVSSLPGAVGSGAFLATCDSDTTDYCATTSVSNRAGTTFTNDGATGPAQVPEPGSLALVGAALAGLGLARRRRAAR